jgi:hypothetical protein
MYYCEFETSSEFVCASLLEKLTVKGKLLGFVDALGYGGEVRGGSRYAILSIVQHYCTAQFPQL